MQSPILASTGAASGRTWIQVLAVFAAGLAFYISLYGELQYHDVPRFIAQVESGHYVWDIGHIFLQPATLLWHQYLGFGESAEMSQKHINSVATAAALAVFYLLLLRLEIPLWRRIAATILVAVSANIITLAPTGHMKLLAFPFLNGAILQSVLWERRLSAHRKAGDHRLWAAAFLLAVGAAFLASCLGVAPFMCLAILLASLRAGDSWFISLRRAGLFGVICGAAFLAFVCFGYVEFTGNSLTLNGLAQSVMTKENLRTAFVSVTDSLARQVYGNAGNFIAAPELGPVMRAWLAHFIPSLKPYAGTLLLEIGPWLATLALIGWIYLRSITRVMKGGEGLTVLAFLLGALSWCLYYNLDDPEHWFALTVPTVLLFLMQFPAAVTRILLPAWAAITAVLNLAYIAIPVASFPLHAGEAEIQAKFGSKDLLTSFAAFPGHAYLGSFKLHGLRELRLDQQYQTSKAAFFTDVDAEFRSTWQGGGRVMVFDVLEPYNWNAPWFVLTRAGLSKDKLRGFLESHYAVVPQDDIARLKVWEIRPRRFDGPAGN